MTCLLVSFIFHTVEQSRQAVTKKEFLPLGQTVYVSKVSETGTFLFQK